VRKGPESERAVSFRELSGEDETDESGETERQTTAIETNQTRRSGVAGWVVAVDVCARGRSEAEDQKRRQQQQQQQKENPLAGVVAAAATASAAAAAAQQLPIPVVSARRGKQAYFLLCNGTSKQPPHHRPAQQLLPSSFHHPSPDSDISSQSSGRRANRVRKLSVIKARSGISR